MPLLRIAIVPALLAAFALGACNDPNTFRVDPIILDDTVALAVPGVDPAVGTALDITSPPGTPGIVGARFPERAIDATQWDFALRRDDGALALVPTGALGFESGAGITRAITDRTFAEIEDAPGPSTFVTDSAVVLQTGAVYVARSRQIPCGYSAASQYARIEAVEIDADAGTVRLRVATNQVCNDTRLTPRD